MNDEIPEEWEELFTAEFWAEGFAKNMKNRKITPIQNFQTNILKSLILYATSENISEIWPKIVTHVNQEKGIIQSNKFLAVMNYIVNTVETGIGAYYVYTEQALVTSVSAMEAYFKDRLIASINKDKRLLLPFFDKQISVCRIVESNLDIDENISELIVEKLNLQNLGEVRKNYKKIYGFYPFTKEQHGRLDFILNSRHMIIHNSGFVDREISYKKKTFSPGQRIFFDRKDIIDMIRFINKLITELDKKIESKITGEVE